MVNINLGAPYEEIVGLAIREGYASSQVEVIRQALIRYREYLDEVDELRNVHNIVQNEMKRLDKGEVKTSSWAQVKKKAGL